MSFPLVTANTNKTNNPFIKISLPKKAKKSCKKQVSLIQSQPVQKFGTLNFTTKEATFQYNGWISENQAYGLGSYTKQTKDGTALTVHGFFNGFEILPCQTYIHFQIPISNGTFNGMAPIQIAKTQMITNVFKIHQKWILQHFNQTYSL